MNGLWNGRSWAMPRGMGEDVPVVTTTRALSFASAGQARIRAWGPHELALIALGTVMPLTEDTAGALASAQAKAGIGALALYACVAMMLIKRTRPLPQAVQRSVVPLMVIAITYTLSSGYWWATLPSIGSARWQLLILFFIGIIGFYTCESLRPGSFVDIVFGVGCVHMVIALVSGETTVTEAGAERLTALNSPVLLAFEATLVLALALVRAYTARSGLARLAFVAVAVIAGYVTYAAFSRTAFISIALGVAAVVLMRVRRDPLGLLAAVLAGTLAWFGLRNLFIDFLGGADSTSLDNASGRYWIWNVILDSNQHPWAGHGFAAMRYLGGPDDYLLRATEGLSAENAILQTLIMGGVVAMIAWLVLAFRALKVLWKVRDFYGHVSVFIAITLILNMIYSVGQSGVSAQIWCLLAAFSLPSWLTSRATQSRPTSAAEGYATSDGDTVTAALRGRCRSDGWEGTSGIDSDSGGPRE